MTRGKYSKTAPVRRANDVLEADLTTYQRKVAAQAAEIKKLREELDHDRQEWGKERRTMMEQRRQGVAPEIGARDRKIAELETQIQRAESAAKVREDQSNKLIQRVKQHFIDDHHFTGQAVVELLGSWLMGKDDILIVDNEHDKKLGREGIERVRRAQLRRHYEPPAR